MATLLALVFAGALVLKLVPRAVRSAVAAALPALTEEEVRQTVTTTITANRPDAFLVTGTLDVNATVRMASTETLLPGVLDLDLGTSEATVRVPGRAHYGFDVRTLRPDDVRVADDGVVEVVLPEIAVHSVEPDLSRMEVETRRGWLRPEASVRALHDDALHNVTVALRNQAIGYVSGSAVEAKTHTAQALAAMLRPALVAAGMPRPRFRFVLAPGLTLDG